MKYFLSCDWGTTSFRIKLTETENGTVLAEETSGQGIALTFEAWIRNDGQPEERTAFYLDVVHHHIKKIEKKTKRSLSGAMLIISGMASSSIGLMDIPYVQAPVAVDGSGMKTAFIRAGKTFPHDVLIISGVQTSGDVMRGEETQLIGCIKPAQVIKNELFILPGTHSKHIAVNDNMITGIKTYMTGEIFALLAQNSILKSAVEPNKEIDDDDLASFKKGVNDALATNPLNSIFKVRINRLFDVYNKAENYRYLSGLLIGIELKDLIVSKASVITLLCGQDLAKYYYTALTELLPAPGDPSGLKKLNVFSAREADEASVMGHVKIANHLKIFL